MKAPLLQLFFLLCYPFAGAFAGGPSGRGEIACPPYVANRADGSYVRTSKRGKNSAFRCFHNKRTAENAGFVPKSLAAVAATTGWYRIRLDKLSENTCQLDGVAPGGVLFLQVYERDRATFGEFCPSIGTYAGYRTDDGFVISSSKDIEENPTLSFCPDGKVVKQQILEFSRVLQGTPTFIARYRVMMRCLSEQYSHRSCLQHYVGVAFHETHSIWPPAAGRVEAMAAGCAMAQQTCASCHPGM